MLSGIPVQNQEQLLLQTSTIPLTSDQIKPDEYIVAKNNLNLEKTAASSTSVSQDLRSFPYLHWEQRLPVIQENIHKAIKELKEDTTSQWGENGTAQSAYGLAHIDEYALVKALIKKNPQQRDFYVLDIGAGEFGFGRGLASYLNKDKDLPQNIKVHIIGLRGEQHLKNPIREEGICCSYEYGAFQIENILAEFKSLGLDWKQKIDVIVSSWCFRHLVDPLGTFLQTYTLLRPGTGLLLMDGFFYNCGNRAKNPCGGDEELYLCNVGQLLLLIKTPFLMYAHRVKRILDQFIVQRKDQQELFLPLSYAGMESVDGSNWQIGSSCITKFNWRVPYQGFDYRSANYPGKGFCGDAELYDFLKKSSALHPGVFPEYMVFHGPFLKKSVIFLTSASDKPAILTNNPIQREPSVDFKQEESVVNISEAKIITSIVVQPNTLQPEQLEKLSRKQSYASPFWLEAKEKEPTSNDDFSIYHDQLIEDKVAATDELEEKKLERVPSSNISDSSPTAAKELFIISSLPPSPEVEISKVLSRDVSNNNEEKENSVLEQKLAQPIFYTKEPYFTVTAVENSLLKETPDEIISQLFLTNRTYGDSCLNQLSQENKSNDEEKSNGFVIVRCTKHPLPETVREKQSFLEKRGSLRIVPIGDLVDNNISQYFDNCFDFIENALRKGKKVLVHCDAGASRSPTIVAAYLIRKYRLTAKEALNHIRTKRPCVNTVNFTKQLKQYEKLSGFRQNISLIDQKLEAFAKFNALYDALISERVDVTAEPYNIIVDHFTKEAINFARNPNRDQSEIKKSMQELDLKLYSKPPMNQKVKIAICAAIGALLGLVIGGAIGALATGGFGGFTTAILGAAEGFKIGLGIGAGAGLTGGGIMGYNNLFFSNIENKRMDLNPVIKNNIEIIRSIHCKQGA